MKAVEMYYTVQELSLLLRLHEKTVVTKLRAGEFGSAVVNLGSELRPDYRLPASSVNSFLEGRRFFPNTIGIAARNESELRRKAA